MLKTIFFGNSAFSLPTLEVVHKNTHLVAVVAGADHVVTRRKKDLVISTTKLYAQQHHLLCLQPTKLKDPEFLSTLQSLAPDMGIIISYGKILPREVFELPRMGTFNLHASLLPHYRGASPIQEALLNNDAKTGITLQKINEHIDDGDIFAKTERAIPPSIKYPELHDMLALDAAQTLETFLSQVQDKGHLPAAHKQEGNVSFCRKISKQDGNVSFCIHTAQEIFNRFRAYAKWPQIFTSFRSHELKLENIQLLDAKTSGSPPGSVIQADAQALIIQAKEGLISLLQVKITNRKSLDFLSFIHGYKIKTGDILC